MSNWSKVISLWATRWLYWGDRVGATWLGWGHGGRGLHLTKGQSDPKADQMPSWPKVVSLLDTRCLYWGQGQWGGVGGVGMMGVGVHLTKSSITVQPPIKEVCMGVGHTALWRAFTQELCTTHIQRGLCKVPHTKGTHAKPLSAWRGFAKPPNTGSFVTALGALYTDACTHVHTWDFFHTGMGEFVQST